MYFRKLGDLNFATTFKNYYLLQSSTLLINILFSQTGILRKQRNLEAINRLNHKKPSRSNHAGDTNFLRSHEDYNTLVSENINGRMTNKLSQEFSGTVSWILGGLITLDGFLIFLEPAITETIRNRFGVIAESRSGKAGTKRRSFPKMFLVLN